MKIWLVIKPWDYTMAEVEVYTDEQEAQKAKRQISKAGFRSYWSLREIEITMTPIEKMLGKKGEPVKCTAWLHLWPVKAKTGSPCLCGLHKRKAKPHK